jgi:uncharacterized membrane protein YhaH (DUF805 family)
MVTMWQAFKNFWRGYVNFTGQSTRAEYWWMALWQFIIWTVWVILLVASLVADASLHDIDDKVINHADFGDAVHFMFTSTPILAAVLIIGAILYLAMILPNIALLIRRYRDAGTATWLAWVIWILSAVGGVVSNVNSDQHFAIAFSFTGLFGIISFILTVLPTDSLAGITGIGRPQNETPSSVNDDDNEL